MQFTPDDIARHYGVPRHLTGKGQTVGIISLGERANRDEMEADFAVLKRKFPKLRFRHVPSTTPRDLTRPQAGPAVEMHIDVEVVNAVCPEAKLVVYCAWSSMEDLARALAAAIADDVDVVSISWGVAESQMSSGDIRAIEDQLEQARRAGITVCAASGDFGASGLCDEGGNARNDPERPVCCTYPASSPLVLACGGTSLVRLPDGSATEVVWNDTIDNRSGVAGSLRASGGGVSAQFDRPGWQAGIGIASPDVSVGTGRVLPDVAAVASLVWEIVDQRGKTEVWGGTSAVAPFYAGLVALANQQRTGRGKARLGFLNAKLYDLVRRQGPQLFVDVVAGHNRVMPDGQGYDAGPGFDACTGWGVPVAERLVAELAGLP